MGCDKAKASSPRETARDGRFVAYDNGTVVDTSTSLMWAAKYNGRNINWQDAKNYCDNYRGGGYTGWRMPTQDELAGLYDNSTPNKRLHDRYSMQEWKISRQAFASFFPYSMPSHNQPIWGFDVLYYYG